MRMDVIFQDVAFFLVAIFATESSNIDGVAEIAETLMCSRTSCVDALAEKTASDDTRVLITRDNFNFHLNYKYRMYVNRWTGNLFCLSIYFICLFV